MMKKDAKVLFTAFILLMTILLSSCAYMQQDNDDSSQMVSSSENQSPNVSDTDAAVSNADKEQCVSAGDTQGHDASDASDTSTTSNNTQSSSQNDTQNTASTSAAAETSDDTDDVVTIEPFYLYPNVYEFYASVGGTVDYSSLVMYMDYVHWKADESYEEVKGVVVTEKCNIPQPDTSLEGRHTVEITCTEYGVFCVARVYVNVGNTGLNYTLSGSTVARGDSVTITIEKPSYLSVFGYTDNGLVTDNSHTVSARLVTLSIPEDYEYDTVSFSFFFEDYTSYGRVTRKGKAVINVV